MFRAKDDDVIVLDADEKENDESQEKPEVEVLLSQPVDTTLRTPEQSPQKKRLKNDESTRKISPASRKWRMIQAKLRSPNFSAAVHKRTVAPFEAELNPKARDRESRCKMMANQQCECCRPYYDALGLSAKETSERIQQVSRHRAAFFYEKTPPRYWDLEASSPSPKKSPVKNLVKKRRK